MEVVAIFNLCVFPCKSGFLHVIYHPCILIIFSCVHAASTDNLVLMIIENRSVLMTVENRSDPGQPPGNSDGTNPGTWAEKKCKSPGVARKDVGRVGTD